MQVGLISCLSPGYEFQEGLQEEAAVLSRALNQWGEHKKDREKGVSGQRNSRHTDKVKRIHVSFFNLVIAIFSRKSFYQTKSLVEFHQKINQIQVELLKQLLRGWRWQSKGERRTVQPRDKFRWGGRPGSFFVFLRSQSLPLEEIILQHYDPVYF